MACVRGACSVTGMLEHLAWVSVDTRALQSMSLCTRETYAASSFVSIQGMVSSFFREAKQRHLIDGGLTVTGEHFYCSKVWGICWCFYISSQHIHNCFINCYKTPITPLVWSSSLASLAAYHPKNYFSPHHFQISPAATEHIWLLFVMHSTTEPPCAIHHPKVTPQSVTLFFLLLWCYELHCYERSC